MCRWDGVVREPDQEGVPGGEEGVFPQRTGGEWVEAVLAAPDAGGGAEVVYLEGEEGALEGGEGEEEEGVGGGVEEADGGERGAEMAEEGSEKGGEELDGKWNEVKTVRHHKALQGDDVDDGVVVFHFENRGLVVLDDEILWRDVAEEETVKTRLTYSQRSK